MKNTKVLVTDINLEEQAGIILSLSQKIEELTELKKLQDEQTAATLSFYKWCAKHRQEIHSVYVECIEDKLARFGLKPYKVNHNMDCLVKFKNRAEAIIQIGVCEINLLICKL